jgi:hypothetical protein
MASNGHVEPTETSPLLASASASTSAVITTSPNGVINESSAKPINGAAQTDGSADEEAGGSEEPDNPIFEGMPEVAARLHILTPAVAIGVCSKSRYAEEAFSDAHRRYSWRPPIKRSL